MSRHEEKLEQILERFLRVHELVLHEFRHLNQEVHELRKYFTRPHLTSIRLTFSKGRHHMPTQGPVTLASGQSAVATVLYFDQTGAPMPVSFVPPAVTFAIDNSAIASSTPIDGQSDTVAYVSAGVANLTASVTSAEGLALADSETVTCSPVVLPPPVLSSIKIAFSDPA